MDAPRTTIVPGTLDMLVLKTLSLEPQHGWGIVERIEQLSRDVFALNQGSLYPALERMLRRGLIRSEWRTTDNNRRARYYVITAAGREQLATERSDWERSYKAINFVLRTE